MDGNLDLKVPNPIRMISKPEARVDVSIPASFGRIPRKCFGLLTDSDGNQAIFQYPRRLPIVAFSDNLPRPCHFVVALFVYSEARKRPMALGISTFISLGVLANKELANEWDPKLKIQISPTLSPSKQEALNSFCSS